MATNAEILNALAQANKDSNFSKRSKATYLGILNDAHTYVITETECLMKIDSSITLVANTQEYSVPSGFIKFPVLRYDGFKKGFVTLGDDGEHPLTPVSIKELDSMHTGWRGVDAGTPRYCYVTDEGTPKLGFFPAPSSTFITNFGTTCRVYMVFAPTAIADDSNRPFDNSNRLTFLQFSLKLHANWQIALEDRNFTEAASLKVSLDERIETDIAKVATLFPMPHVAGFASELGVP